MCVIINQVLSSQSVEKNHLFDRKNQNVGVDEDEKQEALDNYYADCECSYEEITEEEYKENGGV